MDVNTDLSDVARVQQNPTTHARQSIVKPEAPPQSFSCTKLEIYSSPASPTPANADNNACAESCETIKEIPLELNAAFHPRKQYSLIRNLIKCYSAEDYTVIRNMYSKEEFKKRQILSKQLQDAIKKYLHYAVQVQHEVAAADLVQYLQEITTNMELILKALIEEMKLVTPANHNANRDLYFNVDITPAEYREHLQRQSITYVVREFQSLQHTFVNQLLNMLESVLFNYVNADKLTLEAAINLTQLYLICILNQDGGGGGGVQMPANPARLFIAKCLYYHLAKSVPMIYEVLCCFPTVLPHREERSYDHSDALITVIQHVLMCTKYDMDKHDLRTKELLSKLRFQYHYEPFKPNHDEVFANLMEKLKANKLEHIKYAFAIICKRLHPVRVTTEILQAHLLPLANEYYTLLQQTSAYDERIAAVLECITIIIKPFPVETDVSLYLSLLRRFLNAVPRSIIQEAAVQAILRLQRFGYANCYRALQTFKPQHNLQPHTKAMLKTFIHRKSLKFWQSI